MSAKSLSAKQQIFVASMIAGKTQTQAAIDAKVPEKNARAQASRWMTKANIRAAVEAGLANMVQEVTKAAVVDKAWVLAGLVENAQRALQKIPVLDKEGNETGEWKYEGAVANKAFELIGKHIGFFPAEKREITGKDGAPLGGLVEVVVRTREEAKDVLSSLSQAT